MYNNQYQNGPRRTTPLIQRPQSIPRPSNQTSSSQPSTQSQSYLGSTMGTALAGMGYHQQQQYPPPPAMNNQYNPYPFNNTPSQPYPFLPPQPPPPQHYPPSYPSHYPPPQNSYSQPILPPLLQRQPQPSTSSSSSSSLPPRPQQSHYPASSRQQSSFNSQYNPVSQQQQAAPLPRRQQQPPPSQSTIPSEYKCCQFPSCQFTSKTRRIVREHEEDRHLVFEPGREPKPWSGSLKPIEGAVIEGTGISLDTPEAVAKWIADRKKRWPTKKIVEEKEKQREERIKAGLEAPPRERNSNRGGDRGRGRGGGRGGGSTRDNGYVRRDDGQDERAQGKRKEIREGEEGPVAKKVKLDDDEDSSSGSSTDSSSDSDSETDDDDSDGGDGPQEMATTKDVGDEHDEDRVEEQSSKPSTVPNDGEDNSAVKTKRFQVVCRHWRKGNCQLGDSECPYLHTIPENAPAPPPPRRPRPHPRPTPHNPFSRPFTDPFSLLEETELKHIVNDLLQVVEFVKANDFLKGVERRVGELEEMSGIEVLKESENGGAGGKHHDGIVQVEDCDGEPIEETNEDEMEEEEEKEAKEEPIEPSNDLPSSTVSLPLASITTSSTSATTVDGKIITPSALPTKPMGLVADYGSDSENDSEDEMAVAAALRPDTSA